MDAADRALLAETVLGALGNAVDTDAVLAELGWLDMLDAETDDAIAIVFDALGRTNAAASAIDDVVVHAIGLELGAGLAVLIPACGAPTEDLWLATARVRDANELVLAVDGAPVGSIPIGDADVEPVGGIDPEANLFRVRVDVTSARPLDRASGSEVAVARAQRALGHQIAGASRTMLDLAREHALTRVQFGRPVSQFQAVRHRLAEALVAVEALDAALDAAAADPGPLTAQLAKALAGQSARIVAGHAQQVLAGIGFTTDHPFHRFLKRTMLLDGMFGSSDDLVVSIGQTLLAARAVPTLIEL